MNLIEVIKESWGWAGIDPYKVVADNDFGNLIIRDHQDKYWRLCPEEVYCKIVAENRAAMETLWKDEEFLLDWHMQASVELANEILGPLKEGRKYYLVIPGVLGGESLVHRLESLVNTIVLKFFC